MLTKDKAFKPMLAFADDNSLSRHIYGDGLSLVVSTDCPLAYLYYRIMIQTAPESLANCT